MSQIIQSRHQSKRLILLFCTFMLLGCTPDQEARPTQERAVVSVEVEPTITPFQPRQPTETPGVLQIGVSNAIPRPLMRLIQDTPAILGRSIVFQSDAEKADLRIGIEGEFVLTRYVYALVAPFPTLDDSISFQDLEQIWRGNSSSELKILIASKDVNSLEQLLGPRSNTHVSILQDSDLVDAAWGIRPAMVIVPFEGLEPRWKVIDINGLSPIDKPFAIEDYELTLRIALSGDPRLAQALIASLSLPESNRDSSKFTDLIMTGVTALTRATAWRMEQYGSNYPAEKIGELLKSADLTHVSNEVSFLQSCPPPSPIREGLIFCSNPKYAELLETIGVDLVEMTGNHLGDYGEEAIYETLQIYRDRGWQYFGGGENLEDAFSPALIEHNGNKLAFLGCNFPGPPSVWAKESSPGATPCDYELLFQKVSDLRSNGYLPIFTFQWSEHYQTKPSLEQVKNFRAAIDAGAVIVSGSQAHQPQALEFYGGGLIHYGVGNLFFDQMWALAVREEFIDRHIFYDGRHISTELLTTILEDYSQPRPMTSEERERFLEKIFAASGW
ncbi:MAG: CapA family protein [Chloroflexi bacterium]|nr:CapA family protein [Chloroflexota bacterium]